MRPLGRETVDLLLYTLYIDSSVLALIKCAIHGTLTGISTSSPAHLRLTLTISKGVGQTTANNVRRTQADGRTSHKTSDAKLI